MLPAHSRKDSARTLAHLPPLSAWRQAGNQDFGVELPNHHATCGVVGSQKAGTAQSAPCKKCTSSRVALYPRNLIRVISCKREGHRASRSAMANPWDGVAGWLGQVDRGGWLGSESSDGSSRAQSASGYHDVPEPFLAPCHQLQRLDGGFPTSPGRCDGAQCL